MYVKEGSPYRSYPDLYRVFWWSSKRFLWWVYPRVVLKPIVMHCKSRTLVVLVNLVKDVAISWCDWSFHSRVFLRTTKWHYTSRDSVSSSSIFNRSIFQFSSKFKRGLDCVLKFLMSEGVNYVPDDPIIGCLDVVNKLVRFGCSVGPSWFIRDCERMFV